MIMNPNDLGKAAQLRFFPDYQAANKAALGGTGAIKWVDAHTEYRDPDGNTRRHTDTDGATCPPSKGRRP